MLANNQSRQSAKNLSKKEFLNRKIASAYQFLASAIEDASALYVVGCAARRMAENVIPTTLTAYNLTRIATIFG